MTPPLDHIVSLGNASDQKAAPVRQLCRKLRPADVSRFWIVQFEDGSTAVVHDHDLKPVPQPNVPKPPILIEPV